MSVGSQEYAGLANDNRGHGGRAGGTEAPVWIEGVKYDVLEQYDSLRTGYHGTIYQRAATGEIVVAHRGTEFDRELLQDGHPPDADRMLACSDLRLPEAMALTWRAMALAVKHAEARGVAAAPVTTTGHSLGGGLAQITAFRLELRGEAFNPHGAASLGHGVPEGGHRFINHVIATDAVSAASRHYGQVRIYAREQDVLALWLAGYGRFEQMPERMLGVTTAARTRLASHHMHNFLGIDGDGKPAVSVLQDPATLQRAQENRQAIVDYREQFQRTRGGIGPGRAASQARSGGGQPVRTATDDCDVLARLRPPPRPTEQEPPQDQAAVAL